MSAASGWESVLKETSFDLSPERWQAIEEGLRRRIREEESPAVQTVSLIERLRERLDMISDWIFPAKPAWIAAGACALILLAVGVWHRPQSSTALASLDRSWKTGETIDVSGTEEWTWGRGRSRISLHDGSIRLDRDSAGQVAISVARGEATFHVDHRKPEESFHVAFGACRIEVVGTAFTIHADSASASARVLEGRVRFVGPAGMSYLDAGQELSCSLGGAALPLPSDSAIEDLEAPEASIASPSPKPATPSVATPSKADAAFLKLAETCRRSGTVCTEARAEFVRRFSSDVRAPEVAWQWGQSARAQGDLRDALFAWDVTARSPERIGLRATIAACELRLGSLADANRAARDLDQVIPRLEPGSTLWIRSWTLRRDAAKILGQSQTEAKAESLLSVPSTVYGGP